MEDETLHDVVLACITKSGRNEEDLLADYQRRCIRKKIVPLYGQLKNALRLLLAEGKIGIKTTQGHKLCFKR